MLIDTHAHLDSLEDLAGTLQRAREAGVGMVVAVSSSVESSRRTLKIAHDHDMVFAAVGIHPHTASESSVEDMDEIRRLAREEKVVAVGESGLDYYWMNSPRETQLEFFRLHARLAVELGLPLVVHIRDAFDDALRIVKEEEVWRSMGVVHCFSGDWEAAKPFLDQGFYISFSGMVTFKNASAVVDAARKVPLERLLIETDTPYLAPVPHRGKPNEPAYVRYVAEKIAEIRGEPVEKIVEETTINARNLFVFENEEVPSSIAYRIGRSLYLNITNRCTLGCVFCGKWKSFRLREYDLRLKREPTVDEVLEAAGDVSRYEEVVFVGWGESTLRLEDLKAICGELRRRGAKRIRVDTDGLANLVHGRNVLSELEGLVDAVSVSLNAQDAETYARICPSRYGEKAYEAVLQFIRDAKKYIPHVTATVVTVPGVDVEACRRLVEHIGGVEFRARTYGRVG